MPIWKDVWTSLSKRYVLTTITVLIFLFFLYSSIFLFADRGTFLSPLPIPYPQVKLVIWWNPFFGTRTYVPLTLTGLGCRFDNCRFTFNRSSISNSDAVIFHWRDLNPSDLPPKDQYETKWVVYNYESPSHTPWNALKPVISRIDWVVTYRHDSDIVAPYGAMRHRKWTDISWSGPDLSENKFKEKKSVAWLVSNCHSESRRERYVQTLKKHIPIDIYGRCGSPLKICLNQDTNFCYGELGKMYKFYLAFENSLFLDYVTEKAFLPLAGGMIPIVFGGANYSNVLPPNSFVNVMDFHTPDDLADHLLAIDKNYTLYQTYHTWRKDYVLVHSNIKYYWLCDLCQLLHENYSDNKMKNEKTFYDWWYRKSALPEGHYNISF